jgi:hypothetical protein
LLLLLSELYDLFSFCCCMQQQTQYLHQFVLHASLDAVDEAMWSCKELHLKVSSGAKNSAAVLSRGQRSTAKGCTVQEYGA